ncbi:uncharacterized protein LOC141673702 [Apium graveolens]|uniref:uncharacterized protein LOC141673702 n=1 Tax=Apium graveolens TaxID=4045 RepID=UPI003D792613
MCLYYCFWLQQRANEGHTLLLAGRLLQQYTVDAYMEVEQERFRWIRTQQSELRTELYSGLMNAVHRGDSDSSAIGKSVVLPSSHTGGPRYSAQNYQDVMAICRWVGYPDLFITFTCKPKWKEINDILGLIDQKDDLNKVDIVSHVFEIKLQQLMHYIKKEQPFGKVMACKFASLYTIKFQKRGLPHAHILLFLHQSMKNPSPEYINTIISEEIPDINVDPNAYNAVKKSMLHGPCGQTNVSSPCMYQGKCAKFFPKTFNDITTIGEDGFPIYRRRNTGPDRETAVIETVNERDEIKAYLDCRYISACEAWWRIFQFSINYRYPAVERLPFHLPNEHTIIFEENRCIENVLNMPGVDKIKFTKWEETNKRNNDARSLTYAKFPQHWVWNSKGRTSFERMRTIDGVTYPTFKAVCYALGLLDDDKEWIDCLSEAAVWATGNELHNLFVTMLVFCQVFNVLELWRTHSEILSEDMLHLQRRRFQAPNLQLTKEQMESYALAEIDDLMQKLGKSLKDIDGMPHPDYSLTRDLKNRLLNKELDYDRPALKTLHEKSLSALNQFQRSAYDAILHSVQHDEGKLFFISGHGGTGKTFLWNTIASKLRSESLIVLPVATSGLASLLLPNGRTAHSRFRIPLDITAESTCEIKHGTQLAKLLQKTSLIIWDEAPMTHKYCFEALDKTLRDLMSIQYDNSRARPFGGLIVVYVAMSRVTGIEGLVIVNADSEVKDQALIKNIVYKEVFNNIQNAGNAGSTSVGSTAKKINDSFYDYCNSVGHTRDKCFCLHEYPDWHKLYGKPKPKPRRAQGTTSFGTNVKSAAQISTTHSALSGSTEVKNEGNNKDSMLFTDAQCQQLAKMIHDLMRQINAWNAPFNSQIMRQTNAWNAPSNALFHVQLCL